MKNVRKSLIIFLSIIVGIIVLAVTGWIVIKQDHTKPKITIKSPEIRKDISESSDWVTNTLDKQITVSGEVSDNIKIKTLEYKIKKFDRFSFYEKVTVKKGRLPAKKKWKLKDIPLYYQANQVEITATDWNNNKKTVTLEILNNDKKLKWREEQAAVKEGVLLFSFEKANEIRSKTIQSYGQIASIYRDILEEHMTEEEIENIEETRYTFEIKKDNQLEELYQEGTLKIGTIIYVPDGFYIDGYNAKLVSRKELKDSIEYVFEDMSFKPEKVFKKEWKVK